jgi:hypothetical protein
VRLLDGGRLRGHLVEDAALGELRAAVERLLLLFQVLVFAHLAVAQVLGVDVLGGVGRRAGRVAPGGEEGDA